MLSWEMHVDPIAGDNSVPINAAIAALASSNQGGTVHLAPVTYTIENPIIGRSNVLLKGAFNGAHLFDSVVNSGTILRWDGVAGGTALYDAPASEADRIDCAGIGGIGLQCLSAYYRRYARIHCVGATTYAYYWGTLWSTNVVPNYHPQMDSLTAVVTGAAHGIVLDGYPSSGRDTCFASARNCHITFQNGIAYCIPNADNCGFVDCAGSRMSGASGTQIWFGGSNNGKCAQSNRFLGYNCGGGGYISAADGSYPSRGNYVLTNAEDGVPDIYRAHGASLTVDVFDGEPGYNGFVRDALRGG